VEDETRLIVALAGAFAFAALAILTWIALRLESVRRALRPRPPCPPCERLHVEDLHARLMDAPPQDDVERFLAAEDLPPFRGPTRPIVDEDEVNPRFPVKRS